MSAAGLMGAVAVDVAPERAGNAGVPGARTCYPAQGRWGCWRAEVAFAERFVAEAPDLDVTVTGGQGPVSLREVLVHMIEEYARHNGHADFLCERIDGRVGQ
jgi:hypothetical protein